MLANYRTPVFIDHEVEDQVSRIFELAVLPPTRPCSPNTPLHPEGITWARNLVGLPLGVHN